MGTPEGGWEITGCGAVASVGGNVDDIFGSLCAGRSGLAPLRGLDRSRVRASHAYEIDDGSGSAAAGPLRATRWLCQAVGEAVRDAGLTGDLSDVPVLVGTGLRELRSVELCWREGVAFDVRDLHFGPALSSRFRPAATYTFSNACSASLYALALATDLLAMGTAETVVVAGVDAITESMFGLLDRVQQEPPDAVRPFDRDHHGVLLGEGAAAVVVRRPRATVPAGGTGRTRAVLHAVAVNCDAYHVTAPDPTTVTAAIREAHARAGIEPADVDLVLAHGTGTVLNDRAEATALSDSFTAVGAAPLVTAIKSMTGHTSGGSGLLGVIVAAESLRAGLVPPIVGLTDPVPEATGLRLVRGRAEHAALSLAQVNAFGFGGVNAVAIVGKAA